MNLSTRSRARPAVGRSSVLHDVAEHQHVVEFYDSEEFLVGTVAGFVGPALNSGDAAIVVATAPHRKAFEAAMRKSGVDVGGAVAGDRYLTFDAAERIEGFMKGGVPDARRFADMAAGVIQRAAAGGRRVRIYGEMVALLWEAGDVATAILLEDLWNDLAGEREFMLLCAYPMRSFERSASGTDFLRICDRHSTVIPSEDYAMLGGVDSQQRAVAHLQQQTTALRADVARLRSDQIVAELDHITSLATRSHVQVGESRTDRPRVPAAGTTSPPAQWSPGRRLLNESLRSLTGRLYYADE